ncbi:hypothetical protein [Azospirillum palustre]
MAAGRVGLERGVTYISPIRGGAGQAPGLPSPLAPAATD